MCRQGEVIAVWCSLAMIFKFGMLGADYMEFSSRAEMSAHLAGLKLSESVRVEMTKIYCHEEDEHTFGPVLIARIARIYKDPPITHFHFDFFFLFIR